VHAGSGQRARNFRPDQPTSGLEKEASHPGKPETDLSNLIC
jgi:hypothetical protein